ncbi:MAG: response regulator transcription factor [Acidobacteriaceae bacterium]|nr:response regulator transcription factor [Acidobacteriaceae bacterium]
MIRLGLLNIAGCHELNISVITWLHVVDLERFQISLFYQESTKECDIDVWVLQANVLRGAHLLFTPSTHACNDRLRPVVAVCRDDGDIDVALDNHAAAIVLAYDAPWQLIAAIHSAAETKLFISSNILHPYVDQVVDVLRASPCDAMTDLTDREMNVLSYIAQGLTNKQIAQRLHITKATVDSHVLRILRKLHVANRTEATAIAYKTGFPPGTSGHSTKNLQ